jgi:hypothetical protein
MIMIPAKTQCPSSWTREYYGYLMTIYLAIYLQSQYTLYKLKFVYFVHTAQDTTRLAWYGGHWRPLHEATT